MFVLECSSKYSNNNWIRFYLSIFHQIVSNFNSQRALDFQSCFIPSSQSPSHSNLFCLARTFIFRTMLKVSWGKSHPVQFLKAPQMTKIWILQLKKPVDLMLAMAKIHSKVKSQQLLHVKSIKTVLRPNHWTVENVYWKRVLSWIYLRLPV